MKSFAEVFRSIAAPRLVEQFGPRDERGELQTLKYFDPTRPDAEPFVWRGIRHPIRFQDVVSDPMEGGLERREARTWDVLRSDVDRDGVSSIPAGAKLEDDDGAWTVDQSTTVWGDSFIVIGLARKPLMRRDDRRRASAV